MITATVWHSDTSGDSLSHDHRSHLENTGAGRDHWHWSWVWLWWWRHDQHHWWSVSEQWCQVMHDESRWPGIVVNNNSCHGWAELHYDQSHQLLSSWYTPLSDLCPHTTHIIILSTILKFLNNKIWNYLSTVKRICWNNKCEE